MSNSLEITGKLIVKYDTQQVSEKFKKREFVIELQEEINGNMYTNFAKFQLVQNKCDVLDRFNVDATVKVSFNIKGNKWERDGKVSYMTNLDAWRIEAASGQQPSQGTPGNWEKPTPHPAIPIHASNHPNNGGNNIPTDQQLSAALPSFNPSPETIYDLPF